MRAGAVSRTPSAACGCACAWRSFIRRSCSPRRVAIAERCRFSLDALRYEYPAELVPAGHTPASWLRKLTEDGLRWRFPAGVPAKVGEPGRARAAADRRAALRAVLPHRARRRALRARPGNSLPGPRIGGELGGVLCAGHHRGRPRADEYAVRALRLARAQRAARHRRRLRARAARGGDPVRLREIRPRARRARRHGDLLPHEKRAARRRQGARPAARRSRRAGQELHVLGPETRALQSAVRARRHAARLSAPPVAARRRLRHLARPAGRAGADRERGDGRAHRDPVGQGRPRGARPAQGRRARARHAHRDPQSAGDDRHPDARSAGRRMPRSTT